MACTLEIIKGDIVKVEVEAVVNAANANLSGGGGVDGAIHEAAGPGLARECKALGGCLAGEAKLTKGYHLPVKCIIHTVGPTWHGGVQSEPTMLSRCYVNSLRLAEKQKVTSIAFPSISTGAYGYPVNKAVRIALKEFKAYMKKETCIEKIVVVCFEDAVYDEYQKAYAELFR